MAVGKISTHVLTDIANAIRRKGGTAAALTPREMPGAIAALDGTDAGAYEERGYVEPAYGVLPASALSAIADAIRAKGGYSATFKPDEMPAAICALEFDVGMRPRALLLANGTLEFACRDRAYSPLGAVAQKFDVDAAGYASAVERPWDGCKWQVRRVVFDSSFADAGVSNLAHWCSGFSALEVVEGFQHCSGAANLTQAFASCARLRSIYATGFDISAVTTCSLMFYGCTSLVGGADGAMPFSTSGKQVLATGAGGVLTDPANDARTWFWAHLYADGEAVLTADCDPDPERSLIASGPICANARYAALGFQPWDIDARALLTSAAFAPDMGGFAQLNLNYLFYGCLALHGVSGMGNLRNVRCMRYAFSSCGLGQLDLRGFDPSGLEDVSYCFAGSNSLSTIYADAGWALPTSGLSGAQCFYNCTSLVGGNGTAYANGATSSAMLHIDAAGSPGYLTAG